MKSEFTVSLWQEEDLFVAQCLEVDIASQGSTEEEALANLREALELHGNRLSDTGLRVTHARYSGTLG